MIEVRDLIRWFKKGFVFISVFTVISVLANRFLSLSGIIPLLEEVMNNPAGIKDIITGEVQALVWALVALPIIGGYLLEQVDRRIRK